ncbi:MAG: hypothetical protein OEV93_03190 [Candidatus Moranbacteria bacterium]|nr:hypothetical protein [Candidatus Moranbacteria bacterium]
MKIYLAGSVPKSKEEIEKFVNWREGYKKVLKKYFDCECVNPFVRDIDETDLFGVFGFDCGLMKDCDLVVVNASDKLGAGTAQEMVIAKYFKKPVVTILPKNTYQRRSNVEINGKVVKEWMHPFVFSFSDFIIEDIEEIGDVKEKISNTKIKTIEVIDEAIEYFESKN